MVFYDFLKLAFLFLFLGFLSIIIFFLPYFLAQKKISKEKLSSYECGFNPFSDTRNEFDVKFFLVGILFMIFDLELTFLFPFLVSINKLDSLGLTTAYIFILVLSVGFFYEWKKGALDWRKIKFIH